MEVDKPNKRPNIGSDEISLRDFIIKVREWIAYLWRKKFLIALICLITGAFGLVYSLIKKTTYLAELTFVLEDNKSNPLGAYSGLASQFGIDLGGIGSNGAFSGDNIIELLQSRLLIEKALLSGKIIINNKEFTLAEWYIEYNNLRTKWGDRKDLRNLYFPINSNRSNFTLQQDSVLYIIQSAISEKALKVEKPDKKLSFISVQCSTTDELFSKLFIEKLVAVALDMYVNTKTQRNKANIDRLQIQADSLEQLLNHKTYSAALVQDINSNPARQVAGVSSELALRDKTVLQTMYAEVIRNLELSKLSMAQESPIIQIVDTPILPLKKQKLGKIKAIIIGGFIGFFLSSIFLILRNIYMKLME